MIKRTLEISSGATRLSVANGQLVIRRDDMPDARVPCEDIGVLIIDHPATSYTQAVMTELTHHGAVIVICGSNHHPTAIVMPVEGNSIQTERQRQQIAAPLPIAKRAWQNLVSAKIKQQAAVLAWATGEDAGLASMADRVRSGDPDNLEAQAAQRYWPRLMGADFRRLREGGGPNAMLNYGYAIIRASMARAICAAGLLPSLGVNHRNKYNAFCLADDLMEPYRPYVDWRVKEWMMSGQPMDDIGRPQKQALLGLLNETLLIGERKSPMLLAMHATAASLVNSFSDGKAKLALPQGMPLKPTEQSEE